MNTRGVLMAFLVAVAGCEASSPDDINATDDLSMTESADGGAAADARPADGSSPADMAASCAPDLMVSMPCGMCGTKTTSCVDGQPTTSACMGEHGECVTGSVIMHPDGCLHRVCNSFCRWDGWVLNTGAVCSKGFYMGCNAGAFCPHEGRMDCQPTCKYGPCYCPP